MALKHRTNSGRRNRRANRRGLASLEVVMTAAVMLPIAAAILWLGFKMAAIVYQFARLLYSQQASTNLTMRRLVGEAGVVSVGIPANGVGHISLNVSGELTEHLARSTDGQPVSRGTAIVITALGGDAVLVRPVAPPASRTAV